MPRETRCRKVSPSRARGRARKGERPGGAGEPGRSWLEPGAPGEVVRGRTPGGEAALGERERLRGIPGTRGPGPDMCVPRAAPD